MNNLLKHLLKYKDELLDLSSRNRLINSRFSSRSKERFHIIGEVLNQLYENLINGKAMKFVSLPNKPKIPPEGKTIEFKKELEKQKLIDEEYFKEIMKKNKFQRFRRNSILI